MHTLNKIVVFSLVFFVTVAVGFKSNQVSTFAAFEARSIDLIFANSFEALVTATLTSETPFNGSLPALEPDNAEVGFTAGTFNVDQTGQASYSIPIYAGAGTAGVAPIVELQYSSAGGNGHVGVGWAISGVTVINRCRETEESRDSSTSITPSPITYGVEDKFCLNGERLFVSNGGIYGADATEYRTEKEQFARITSIGGTGNNPNYFTVERRDGSKSFYGNTINSNITVTSSDNAINGKTYAWAINRYEDTLGNYISYDYNKLSNTEFVLTDIDWTGNDSVVPVLAPYNNISFIYESRSDTFTSYLGGVQFDTTQRLAQIQSSIDGTLVREYTLDYETSSTSSRSLFNSIQECRGLTCFPATTFNWSEPNKQFRTSDTSSNIAFPSDVKSSKLGDVNADGRADLVIVDDSTNTFKVGLADGHEGFIISGITSVPAPTGTEIDNKWHLIDYNADGRQDLLKQSGTNWVVHLALSGAIGFSATATPTNLSTNMSDIDFQIVDVNGDGLSDLLFADGQLNVRYLELDTVNNEYRFSNTSIEIDLPNKYFDIPGIDPPPPEADIDFMVYQFYQDDDINVEASDINGDGVADLILRSDLVYVDFQRGVQEGEQPYIFLSAGQNLSEMTRGGNQIQESSHWVAFVNNGIDGNGRLDYYSELYYIEEASSLLADADRDIRFSDFNADGLTDIITKNTTNNWRFRLSNGKGYNSPVAIPVIANEYDMQLFDFNRDNYVDIIFPSVGGNQSYSAKTWTGSGFTTTSIPIGANAINTSQNLNLFMDLDGDAAVDHFRVDNGGDQLVYPREEVYQQADLITTFTNGFGDTMDVLYRPMTFSSTYAQGDHQNVPLNFGLGSPVLDLMGAVYVVRQVDNSAPIEGDENFKNSIRYRYENAKVQAGGRGFLGFEKVSTATPVKSETDTEPKILQTTTTYRQDFPFNGIPVRTEVMQLDDDYYDPANVPPNCGTGDSCLPPPCEPGTVCEDIPRRGPVPFTMLSEIISTPTNTNPTAKSNFTFISATETRTYDPDNGNLLKTVEQTSTHDAFGNPQVTTQIIKDGAGTILQTNTTTNSYDNFTTNGRWLIGLLKTTTTTKARVGKPSITVEAEFEYDENNGLLEVEVHHPKESNNLFLRIKHEYDDFGNETKIISCSKDLNNVECSNNNPTDSSPTAPTRVHRYNRLTYDDKGRYVDETYNTLEQKISDVTSRDIYGNPLTSVDLLGRNVTNTYDVFGRLTSSRNTLGEWSQTSRNWCGNLTGNLACPVGKNAVARIRELTSGGSESYSYLDIQVRAIATVNKTFNATDDGGTVGDERWIFSQVWFDQFGRQVKSEGPHFLAAGVNDIPVSTTEFDRYSRPTKVTLPDSSSETMQYEGFVTIMTNGNGQRKQETKNALGQLVEVRDFDQDTLNPNYQNTLEYAYTSLGLVDTITRTTSSGTELLVDNGYDISGRKTRVEDVDSGLVISEYNGEGEIIETEDAEGQILLNYYDTLGRVYRTDSFNSTTPLTRTVKTFNSSLGLLTTEEKFLGTDSLATYTRSHTYDNLNRASSTQINFQDLDNVCGGLNCNYVANVYYDQFSRIKFQQDVSSKAIQNHYNGFGFMTRVSDAATGDDYYEILKTDKWGNIAQDRRAGNTSLTADFIYDKDRGWLNAISSLHQDYDYDFDVLGNLESRVDIGNSQSECFRYDRLNRLERTTRFNNAAPNCASTTGNIELQTIAYDGRGNITQKDGQTYSYLTANPTTIGASPHQVQSKGGQTFLYDDNGNMTSSTGFVDGNGQFQTRTFEYTAFDKVSRIYTGNTSNPVNESIYRYDTDEIRYARVDTNSDNETSVTHFMGNVEVEYNSNGQIAFKRQLGNYAVITETNSSTQETYLFNDHLGSIDVITDGQGRILQRMSFSAWGERRMPVNWNQITVPDTRNYLSDYTTRGFTGHEMVDAFGIINMGGRIYDAALGRVLQADPFVQDPMSSQSFNRYTYGFNNPLSFTDPSGFISLRKVVGAVVGIVLGTLLSPLATSLWKAFWVGFATGFVSGAIVTGNLRGALTGGLIAGALAGIGYASGNYGGAETGTNAKDGVGNHQSANAFSESNPILNELTSTTSDAFTNTASQTGAASATTVGENLSRITVTGDTTVVGDLLSDFVAEYWFDTAIAIGSTAFLSDIADLVDLEAQSFPEESVSRLNFEDTAFEIRDTARQAQNVIDSHARTRAVLMGAANIAITSFLPIGRAYGWAKGAVQSKFKRILLKRKMARVIAAGKQGEDAVRAIYEIGSKPKPINIAGRNRIPDGINTELKTLSEVKNYTSKLSYTQQLRDFSAIAKSRGLTFELYVRSNTPLSAPLAQEVAKKNIILKIIPGT